MDRGDRPVWSGIRSKTFSDNVLLTAEYSGGSVNSLAQLSFLAGLLQYVMLRDHSLLTRGCIVQGNLYLNDEIVFGEGLVRAVEGEKAAIHPRVIVDESALELTDPAKYPSFIRKDYDNRFYIDYLQYVEMEQHEGEDDARVVEALRKIGKGLAHRVEKYCRFPGRMTSPQSIAAREKVIAKHLWVLERFNEVCDESEHSELHVSYEPELYRRLMKYHLRLLQG